ncbi:hypothetical protein [Caulobacter sp. 17J65-9]|uniref:hypothetical protein n=1 Tax=Caulobacter sp. 17J65-9 TaxID=2709382 RepID=UPI0013C7407B|nr:hypothetical protein [Caulobacter sp. 17J65-9]NEX91738.1 hypothetical protein [Caulobacter sp. 17J65-9]
MNETPEGAPTRKDAATARVEGIAALGAFVSARQCLEALDHLFAAPNDYARSALFSGIVVSYARAFEAATDADRGINRHFSPRGIAGFDRTIHDSLLRLRDNYIAHAGHTANDYDVLFVSLTARRNGGEQPNQPAEVLALLGTRAQASLPVGPDDAASCAQLRAHLSALQLAAAERLVASIQAHQSAMLKRYEETGQIGDGRPTRQLGELTVTGEQMRDGFQIPKSEIFQSFPVEVPNFPLAFLSAHYRLVLGEGGVILEETLQRKGGEWLGAVILPLIKASAGGESGDLPHF